ncbi:NAD(P)/FAD-dependent oxidoreductase [Actinophytocola sp. NPDC049390]|uniref:NAD(P)/FAD-dependent oxidoreductase n=1 Tax=Actinophytocola sp. NPDC049390 TaxID=3363894 RepID=UPI0037B8DED8
MPLSPALIPAAKDIEVDMVSHDLHEQLPREWQEALAGTTKRIIIVGGGIAGLRTAEALRERGFSGPLLGITAEPLPPYDRSQLSTVALSDPDWHGVSTPSSVKGFWWFLGHKAVGLDLATRQVQVDDGRRIDYDGLVIATGRRARTLKSAPQALQLRTMADAERLRSVLHSGPRHLVVVGGGLTGMEVASVAATLGWEVTVADRRPHPLTESLGSTVAEWVWRRHRDHGVRLRFGERVVAVHPGDRQRVEFADGTTIDADVVLACVGTVPNTEWLAGSGLDVSGVVRTDDQQQVLTSTGQPAEGVVAVGDVISHQVALSDGQRFEWSHWDLTVSDAQRAAATLLGQGLSAVAARSFATRLYTHEVHVVGLPYGTESVVESDHPGFLVRYHDNGTLIGAVAVDQPDRVSDLLQEVTPQR